MKLRPAWTFVVMTPAIVGIGYWLYTYGCLGANCSDGIRYHGYRVAGYWIVVSWALVSLIGFLSWGIRRVVKRDGKK